MHCVKPHDNDRIATSVQNALPIPIALAQSDAFFLEISETCM